MNAPDTELKTTYRYVELLHVLGFAPLLALTDSLHHAAAMCLLFVLAQCAFVLGTRLLAPLLPERGHLILVVLVGTLCTAGLMQCMLRWQYELTQQLGIYLPLFAVNATLYLNALRSIHSASALTALRRSLPGVLAMCAIAIVIAVLRVALHDVFAAISTPFGVLILLSLLLAAVRCCQPRQTTQAPQA